MFAKPLFVCVAVVLGGSAGLSAQSPPPADTIRISRTAGAIAVDGDLSDPGWRTATPVDRWYEINPGDNTEPKVRSVARLAYDDRYFYAGFEFDDPAPGAIRAPLGDRDNVPPYTDYGGVILDTRHDGRTGVLLLANPRGIQYDAVTDDVSGNEDSSPDFHWESAARITDRGWTLELRIPFSSLRYRNADPQTWGIILYRNYPRQFRYQIMSTRLPRGGNCFICRANPLTGLERLPSGAHLVATPYATASQAARPAGALGTPLVNESVQLRGGLDLKWIPGADHAIDLTVKPDFSQVESDTAQIAANQRFALFFQEKRPFFLEGTELLATPIQAVYTRTITAPRWGARATGKQGAFGYTALVADDAGGGSAIIPGPNSSSLANQDFSSYVFVGRVRRDIGRSFVSVLLTDREAGANGHNRLIGPDFQWRPSATEIVTGQWLFSDTVTPDRPDLSPDWHGQALRSSAAQMEWTHSTTHVDLSGQYKDFGDGFRADTGFVPQVGYRETNGEGGYTFRPQGPVSRVRTFLQFDRQVDRSGDLISREISPGVGMDARWNSFLRFRYANDRVRSGAATFPRQQFIYIVQVSPSRSISQISVDGTIGQEVDFDNSRLGSGTTVNLNATLRPTNHLELALVESDTRLNVDGAAGTRQHLFTANVSRVRATYTFTARMFVRIVGQYVSTRRDPSLYFASVSQLDGGFAGSALFAYKLNWQSVLFLGYGDDRTLDDARHLQKEDRQFFVKIAYAFQR
jgi:hypothetical protein